ncbi:signal transduction histidine kinase [Streptomyces sp. B3I8]|nr:signal transduction histidine kinase [Streptomyces sp. B3I8]
MSGARHRLRPAVTAFLHRLAPRTLRGQLSVVALTTAALLMLVLTVAFNAVAQHRLQHQADDELRTRAAAVATTIDTTTTSVGVLETSNDALLDTNVWIYAGKRLLEEPPNAGRLTNVADALAGRGGRRCITADVDGPLRLCSQTVAGDNSEAMVITALDLSPYRSSADTLLVGSLGLDVVMLACTYALTRLAVGRALRPVRTMTDQATQWSAIASEERFGHTRHPAELARLGTSLDSILDRIRTLLRHERQLTGELSHELRTPLSRIVAELDWWQNHPRTADQTHASHKVIAEAAQSMRTICDTLLDDARGRTLTAPGTTEILPILRRLTEVLHRRPYDAGVRATGLTRLNTSRAAYRLRHRMISRRVLPSWVRRS